MALLQTIRSVSRCVNRNRTRVSTREHPKDLVGDVMPYYTTEMGAAYLGDSRTLLEKVKKKSVHLVMTSPPFALTRQKSYGAEFDKVDPDSYVEWFLEFASRIYDTLVPDGSFVVHLGGTWLPGLPLKSLYQNKLVVKLCEEIPFHLAQDLYWANTAKLPTPAQWVAVKRIRVKDAVDSIWWFCKNERGITRANNRRVLQPYSDSMEELLRRGSYNAGRRPSGHDISKDSFLKRNPGSIPPNLLNISGSESNSAYLRYCRQYDIEVNPARYPVALPEFFVKLLTRKGDVVLDPFAGSNATGEAAQKQNRRWLAFELHKPYLKGSQFRFFNPEELGFEPPQKHPAQVQRT